MKSIYYLIDAYNLLFRYSRQKKGLEESRKRLIEEINEIADTFSLLITLVFDGKGEEIPKKAHFDNIAIVYTSKNQTADEYIIEEVEFAKHPSFVTVVSNDSELSRKCSLLKAKTQTLHTFLTFFRKKKKKRGHGSLAIHCKDSEREIARLLKLFEKKLFEEEGKVL